FTAAYAADLVPYRNWWYGIKTGTEGGTHINMGGKDLSTNPWLEHPELLLKYMVFEHNHPCFHYPFMGPDVGPEGNSMRMDEQTNFSRDFSLEKMQNLITAFNTGTKITVDLIKEELGESSLYKEKCSMPSLYKFSEPLFLVED